MLTLKNGEIIQINPVPFSKGGEAELYEVTNKPGQDYLYKKYLKPENAKDYESKILYMLGNKPAIDVYNMNNINWPVDAVYDNKVFSGFLLKKINAISELSPLVVLRIPAVKDYSIIYQAFAFNNLQAHKMRLTLCYNIAFAYNIIHKTGLYVVGDIKPQNILVNPNGTICLIDMDSLQISSNGNIVHFTKAVTPEYIAPENFYMNQAQRVLDVYWDLWSISILFYQILVGIHPLMGTHPSNTESTLEYSIKNGLYVHALHPVPFTVIPSPHHSFTKLDKELQNNFNKTFIEGAFNPSERTKLDVWLQDLDKAIKKQDKKPVIMHDNLSLTNMVALPTVSNPVPSQKTINIKGIALPKPQKKNIFLSLGVALFLLVLFLIFLLPNPDKKNQTDDSLFNELQYYSFDLIGGYKITFNENESLSKGTFDIIEITDNQGKAILHVYSGSLSRQFQHTEVNFIIENQMIIADHLGRMHVESTKPPFIFTSAEGNELSFVIEQLNFE